MTKANLKNVVTTQARSAAKHRAAKAVSDKPPGPFKPALCVLRAKPPTDSGWIVEPKFDGYRLIAAIDERGPARVWSRNGIEWTQRLPQIVTDLKSLAPTIGSAELDGELVAVRGSRDDFSALQSVLAGDIAAGELVYMVFDAPRLSGKNLRDRPLAERKVRLAAALAANTTARIQLAGALEGEPGEVFSAAAGAGLEGIVCKKIGSPYRPGKTGDWIKIKARHTLVCEVIGFTGSKTEPDAILLGVKVEGAMVYVGRAGSGISARMRAQLAPLLARFASTEPLSEFPTMSRSTRHSARWLKFGLKAEVTCQGMTAAGKLRQPAVKRVGTALESSDHGVRR